MEELDQFLIYHWSRGEGRGPARLWVPLDPEVLGPPQHQTGFKGREVNIFFALEWINLPWQALSCRLKSLTGILQLVAVTSS